MNWFAVMGVALMAIAAALWVGLLKQLGVWRWLGRWAQIALAVALCLPVGVALYLRDRWRGR